MCASVLEGVYPGRVFVDNLAAPRSALLVTFIESESSGAWAFLAGDPANQVFNQALNQAIFKRQVISPKAPIVLWTCDPQDWGQNMAVVLHPQPPIWIMRYHFIARQVGYGWRPVLPEGFTVERMGTGLRQQEGLELPGDVAATLDKWDEMKRLGYTDRGFMDYGFVTLDMRVEKPVIAGWATVDFIVHGHGDLGFFTQPDYRQQGLATIAVAAALEDGFRGGLQQVNWTDVRCREPGLDPYGRKTGTGAHRRLSDGNPAVRSKAAPGIVAAGASLTKVSIQPRKHPANRQAHPKFHFTRFGSIFFRFIWLHVGDFP